MDNKLALLGGTPIVRNHADLISPWPITTSAELDRVMEVLQKQEFSGRNSHEVRAFEEQLCDYIGIKHASLFNSGTAALHGCMASLGIGPGDEVIVPAFTFLAPAMAALHSSAIPIFCDIDPDTFNIDPAKIERLISERTKAIVAVHLQGLPADMPHILDVAKRHNLAVIEDCAQSFGARINKRYCGTMGDIAAHSFMSAKQLATCGELGSITTNSVGLINRANALKTYGEIIDGTNRIYNSYTMGYNYVPNPIQSAFASQKLKSFTQDIQPIIKNAQLLTSFLSGSIPFLIPPYIPQHFEHVYHFYRVKVDASIVGYTKNNVFRQAIMDAMAAEGLKLRLYQTRSVPEQTIFKTLNEHGRGDPWCHLSKTMRSKYHQNYHHNNFPATNKTISESFVVGGDGAAPLYFQSTETINKYIAGFQKIKDNIPALVKYARRLEKKYKEPWEFGSKISDTNGHFSLIKEKL